MPSPIAHLGAAYFIQREARNRGDLQSRTKAKVSPWLPVIVLLSLLPDFDAFVGIALGDLHRFHNNWTHSLFTGLVVAVVVAGVVGIFSRGQFWRWFAISLVCYELHVIMDYFVVGRGVMMWWPFSHERFTSPWPIFYGLHWSDGWLSQRHLWTLINEVGFIAIVGLFCWLFAKCFPHHRQSDAGEPNR